MLKINKFVSGNLRTLKRQAKTNPKLCFYVSVIALAAQEPEITEKPDTLLLL
ncbi:MAG: hypothetical protein UV43_C0012G0016 [Parcubacteria group bacterium GW2011_GWF2_42_7]|nr:MAG: hypothetical protein UV43_C0012G0016 [Parcubacteria group bacterium GW2011_GWF2_42_7]